jgi:hypothetical protein
MTPKQLKYQASGFNNKSIQEDNWQAELSVIIMLANKFHGSTTLPPFERGWWNWLIRFLFLLFEFIDPPFRPTHPTVRWW